MSGPTTVIVALIAACLAGFGFYSCSKTYTVWADHHAAIVKLCIEQGGRWGRSTFSKNEECHRQ